MKQLLNIKNINKSLRKKGLLPANVAEALDVSRTIVSEWFNHKKFPRPKHLLQLSDLLNISYEEIVIEDTTDEPVIAFRKKGRSKTLQAHIESAKEKGWLLKPLVNYLPDESFKLNYSSRILLKPSLDYNNIEKVASDIKRDYIKEDESGVVPFPNLTKTFLEFKAVLIPVFLGHKEKHENAVHIYLPDSHTNWTFLNLDVNIIDFKFWMLHEFAHLLTPKLSVESPNDAEDFADALAGAILFSSEKAHNTWNTIKNISNPGTIINHLKKNCRKRTYISLYNL